MVGVGSLWNKNDLHDTGEYDHEVESVEQRHHVALSKKRNNVKN